MHRIQLLAIAISAFVAPINARAQDDALGNLERLATDDPKPFVLVEAVGEGAVSKGQGVVITSQGHVLTAGHVSWDSINGRFTDKCRVSLRSSGGQLPAGAVHVHKTLFSDREDAAFLEHFYPAELLKSDGSRFIGRTDLALLKIDAKGPFPNIDFYSEEKPKIQLGEVFHLCHFSFPQSPADPTFLISPIEVAGVVQTTSGTQYLAKGYYRVGSSGGAILKEGRLIGIQSAAYTVNAKGVGEIPLGLISFQLVWRGLVESSLQPPPEDSQ